MTETEERPADRPAPETTTEPEPEAGSLVPSGLTEDSGLNDVVRVGRILAASGYFKDAKTVAQGITKVLIGRELGFPAFASMSGIYVIEGRAVMGASLLAAAVKRSPRHDYRLTELTDHVCTIVFFTIGTDDRFESTFTMEDAERAGLVGKDNWRKYPRNMLFARALSNGVRFHCPDLFLGAPVYTPDELGQDVDAAGDLATISIPAPSVIDVDPETGEVKPARGASGPVAHDKTQAQKERAAAKPPSPAMLAPGSTALAGYENAGEFLRAVEEEFGMTATQVAQTLGLERIPQLWSFRGDGAANPGGPSVWRALDAQRADPTDEEPQG